MTSPPAAAASAHLQGAHALHQLVQVQRKRSSWTSPAAAAAIARSLVVDVVAAAGGPARPRNAYVQRARTRQNALI
jgi:hypothetical protein